ncbi:3-oxoadipate enol-lactonase [soil metagenome]
MPNLAIETHGTGDPILFIHGLGGGANVFGPQVGVLSRTHQCIRFDLPGAGRSPQADDETSIAGFVVAALAVLDAQAPGKAVHVVAHSMGTVVAQHLALAAADRVRSLSLIGPVHAPGDAGRKGLRDRAATARSEGLVGIADAVVAAGTSAETKAHRPEVAALVREFIMRQPAEGYARHCEALASVEAADVAKIKAPALLITGDEDTTSPPLAARALADKFTRASLVVLDRCGHWTTFERSSEVTSRVLNFILQQG